MTVTKQNILQVKNEDDSSQTGNNKNGIFQRKAKEENKRTKTTLVNKSPSVNICFDNEENKFFKVELNTHNCIAKDLVKNVSVLMECTLDYNNKNSCFYRL